MHEAVVADHALAHLRRRDDRALAHERVIDLGRRLVLARAHEPRRRVVALRAADAPLPVVEVERRHARAQLHVRGEVRLDRPDVAPVRRDAFGLARDAVLREVVDEHARAVADEARDDVLAEIVAGVAVAAAEHALEHFAAE